MAIDRISHFFARLSPALWLVTLNVVIFVGLRVAAIVLRFASPGSSIDSVLDLLMISPDIRLLIYRPWTLLTYMFVQYDVMHLVINMLWLYMFASVLQRVISPLRLRLAYIAGGVVGAAGYLMSAWLYPAAVGSGLVGASAAVLSIMAAAMILRPNLKFNLFLFGEASLKIVGLIALLLVVIATDMGDYGTHLAHAGGFIAGLALALMWRSNSRRKPTVILHSSTHRNLVVDTPKTKLSQPIDLADDSELTLDTLLDKIRRSGYGSLTEAERTKLFKISSDLQNRRQ